MPKRIDRADAAYPDSLRELDDPPDAIYLAGQLPSLELAVAIVGTRRVDAAGVRFARQLASELARAGCAIVSGGAHGIDTAAHEGALDVGGATIAVLPSRVDVPYPPRNGAMFDVIARTGALLGEHAHDPRRYASVFLARNRLIAALARLVIVVQAPIRSGALSTAAHARKLGRPLMAVPSAPWEPRGEGCLALLAEGAHLCRGSDDALALLAPSRVVARPVRKARPALDPDQRALLEALREVATVDELCEHTRMDAPRVQRALLLAQLAGEVEQVGAGRYARAR